MFPVWLFLVLMALIGYLLYQARLTHDRRPPERKPDSLPKFTFRMKNLPNSHPPLHE